jgi:hypothetical protein
VADDANNGCYIADASWDLPITMQKLTILAILFLAFPRALPAARIPAISRAQAAAAEAACDYLARGPGAFYSRLASEAPLRSLKPTAALEEIEVRAGEPAGARWTMRATSYDRQNSAAFEIEFPSGVDDLLTLEMTERAGRWKIATIQSLVELSPEQRQKTNEPLARDTRAALIEFQVSQRRIAAGFGVASMLLAIGAAATRHKRRIWSSVALSVAALGTCLVFAVAGGQLVLSSRRNVRPTNARDGAFAELRPLLGLRRAMTRGVVLPATGRLDPEVAETAMLWRAQAAGTADEKLSATILGQVPLLPLLRARASANQGHKDKDGDFGRFLIITNVRDAFWPEAVGDNYFVWSLDAGPHYQTSATGSSRGRADEFKLAWELQPMTRVDLVRGGLIPDVYPADPMISTLINLNVPEEPQTESVAPGRTPINAPLNAKAIAIGKLVRITIDRQRLDLPGGAEIAPRGTEAVTAAEWSSRDETEALQDFDQIAGSPFTSPALARRGVRTADALARHNRWADLLKLTDNMNIRSHSLPPRLFVLRARALLRAHRAEEVRDLAKAPALNPMQEGNRPARGQLVDLFVEAGAYEDARRMGSDGLVRFGVLNDPYNNPLRQASSVPLVTTQHFEVYGAGAVDAAVTQHIGELLEAELKRITSHVSLLLVARVRINVIGRPPAPDEVSGSADDKALYNGDITIPLWETIDREVVAVLGHEITHAVVAQAADGNAPFWFAEGLARRMELVERQGNIFQDRPGHIAAISVLEAELEAPVDRKSLWDEGEEAATLVRFLEDRYGASSLNALIASYKGGATSDEAFRAVMKKETTEIDREFRTWGLSHSVAFIDRTPFPYAVIRRPILAPGERPPDQQVVKPGAQPAGTLDIHWSKKPPVKP